MLCSSLSTVSALCLIVPKGVTKVRLETQGSYDVALMEDDGKAQCKHTITWELYFT